MKAPSAPAFEEFALVNNADLTSSEALAMLVEQVCDLFAEDCVLDDVSSNDVVRGRRELEENCRGFFSSYTNLRIEPREVIDAGHTSVMVLDFTAVHTGPLFGVPATGRDVEFSAVAIYRCNEDNTKIMHETFAYDVKFILSQVTDV